MPIIGVEHPREVAAVPINRRSASKGLTETETEIISKTETQLKLEKHVQNFTETDSNFETEITLLQRIFDAISLAHVLYASPAWRGYLSAANIDSLQKQSDGKLSQTSTMYLNYKINVKWHFINRH